MFGSAPASALQTQRLPLLFALVTRADTTREMLFKTRAAEILLSDSSLRATGLSRDEVLLLVQNDAGLLPRSRTWELILSMCLLEEVSGLYRLRTHIDLGNFRRQGEPSLPRALQSVSWSIEEAVWAFFPREEGAWTVRTVRTRILRGYAWFLWTLGEGVSPDERFETLPAFWECGENGDSPIGYLRAVTSVGDTLGALVDSLRFPCSMAELPGDHTLPLNYALDQLLTHRVEAAPPPSWDENQMARNGGGFWPFDDQPESAYPTVDATWDAVSALSSLYRVYDRITTVSSGLSVSRSLLAEYLLASTRFLLRMQLKSGGWGIYRYPGDEPEVPPSDFTTGQTILALCRVFWLDLPKHGEVECLRTETARCLHKACAFLVKRRVTFDALSVWTPFFQNPTSTDTPEDLLRASVWTGTGLLALYRCFDDLRPQIQPLLSDIVELADRYWKPDHGRIAEVRFRVPREGDLHATFGKWSNRYDVTVVDLLLDLFNESQIGDVLKIKFTDSLWDRIEQSVGHILKERHRGHGHWNEPVEGLPLAAATAMAIQTLQYYLIAAGHLASAHDVPPPQV